MNDRVLIVEDARAIAAAYAETLARRGFRADIVGGIGDAKRRLRRGDYGAVLLDLGLPDGDGLTLLREIDRDARPPVIAVTADGSLARAIDATRLGATDFLVKPVSPERLLRAVAAAATTPRRGAASGAADDLGIIGSSPAIAALRRRIAQIARSEATVFITGESGVGKELCAQALHRLSARADGPFIAVNCSAIPADLLESVMFGHVRGAFTGAVGDSKGAVGAAEGGTLFLDEICELDPALQAKLLRFLETETVTPVGAAEARPVNLRIVCATNRNPEAEMKAGRFRADLFYRLHVLPLHAPPLRERGDDVVEIANHLLAALSAREGKVPRGFTADAEAALRAAPWPGNVRELTNAVRRAVVLGDGGWIDAAALGLSPERAAPAIDERAILDAAAARLCHLPLVEVERLVIDAAIARCGSAPRAARALGVSPSTIYRKLESWRDRPRPAPDG